MLLNLAYQYLEEREDAKEVIQNAFLKLWEVRAELNEQSNIKNYLFTLVKNACLNQITHRQLVLAHNEKIRTIELEFQYEALSRLSFDYMELNELKQKISRAIDKLPGKCKDVFWLSRYKDYTNQEIALELSISQKTVEAHITKALKILRSELKDYMSVILFFHFSSKSQFLD